MTFDPTTLEPYLGDLAAGARLTALACALALSFGLALGIGAALMRTAASPLARRAAGAYVDVFRNVPFIVQLFFLFYGLPEIGIDLSAFATGVLALSLAGGAFASDVIRSGILAVEPGVLEAAQVSGLSRFAQVRHIVLPLALRSTVRPLGSVFVNLILTSSVLSAITINELTGSAKIVASDTFQPFEVYALLLLVYAAMTWLVSLAAGALHRRLQRRMDPRVAGDAA